MYQCNNCKIFFEEPKTIIYKADDVEENICPECESDDIYVTNSCDYCGEPCTGDNWFCEDCRERAKKTLVQFCSSESGDLKIRAALELLAYEADEIISVIDKGIKERLNG